MSLEANPPDPPAWRRYATALLAVALALAARSTLDGWLGERMPFATFFIAVCFAGWHGGLGPSGMAVVLSALAGYYYFLSPRNSFVYKSDPFPTAVAFALLSYAVAALIASLRAALRVAESSRSSLFKKHEQLESELYARRKAEEALRDYQEWLRVTMTSIGDGVIATDTKGNVTYLNKVAQDLTGWIGTEYLGRPLTEVFNIVEDSRTRKPVSNRALRALSEGCIVPPGGCALLVSKNGAERVVEDSAAPIRGENSKIIGAVVLFRDITERNQAASRARDAAERLRAVVDTAVDGIVTINEHGAIETVNPAVSHIFGYAPADLIGRNVNMLMPEPYRSEHDKYLSNYRDTSVRKIIGSGREVMGLRRDGTTFPMDLSVSETRLIDGSRIFTGIVRDVTERHRAEAALRESADQFHQLADAMPQIVWTARADGYVDYYNERWYEFTNFKRGEFGEASWVPILHPDDAQRVKDEWYESIRTGRPFQIEARFANRKRGGYVWFLGRAHPVRNERGEIVRWFGTSTDIQELKMAQEALKEADRRKDEFLAMLAHELRNPLAPIRNALNIFRSRATQDPRELLDVVERQVNHLVRLVDDLMDVSRITRGKINVKREPVSLANILESAIECCRPDIDAGLHPFEITLPESDVFVSADATRLGQVFMNLLNNSARYTPRGKRIWLEARVENNQAVVRVRDEGMGIPEELRTRIFDLFTQGDSSIERVNGGLGIGLTIARRLVAMHDGTLEAQSEGLNQGSEFVVRLPLCPAPQPAATEAAPAHDGDGIGKQLRVLVVDDNVDAAESLAMLFRIKGCEVRMAHDGFKTLDVAKEFKPEVVLLDIGLPKMNGYDVARKLRETPEGKSAYLVAQTGWGQEEDRQRSREAGFDAHMVKPLDFNALVALISEFKP